MRWPSFSKFLQALRRFWKRPEVVPQQIETLRGHACDDCEFSDGLQCAKCTCFIPLKIKLATESCPVGHWGEYFNPSKNGILF